MRLSYEESCRRLSPYLNGEIPPMPARLPRADDEVLGVSFFRTRVGGGDDLSDLFLPHTFFGRSEILDAKFRNTDFTESNFCWNDFIDVDFTDAVLARSDLRASGFERVRFVRADLREADLRRSSFSECSFDEARMKGASLTHDQRPSLKLSGRQAVEISWTDDEGDEPDGG